MLKKIIVFALVLTLSVGMLSTLTFSTSADVLYDGGTGTEADPYVIATEASLKALADAVNGGANQAGVFFKLGADITLTGEWTPIGTSAELTFNGNFNGMGHKIDGLNVTATTYTCIGLFGSTKEAVIKNVTVNGSITGHAEFIGSIAGLATTTTVQNCVSNVAINAKGVSGVGVLPCIGGIVGNALTKTNVEYCVNNGNITVDLAGIETPVGNILMAGIAGQINAGSNIKFCINDADLEAKNVKTGYVGGIAGRATGEAGVVSNCASKGNLTATEGITTGCIGGVVSYLHAASYTIENCGVFGTISTPAATYLGYLVGNSKKAATITGCKVSGDVLLGKNEGKNEPADCTTGVANIDDIELAVKTAISEWVKVELPATPEQPENPDTADNVIVAVVVAVLSAFGMATVIYFKKNRANAL